MAHREVLHYGPQSRLSKLWQAVRSFTISPMSIKDPRIREVFGFGSPVSSGVHVSEATALTYAAVWQAVSLIAGDIGSLPLHLYKRTTSGGKERFDSHPLYELLHTSPNPEMSSMTVRETMQAHVMTWGNGYAEIERDNAARPIALWPLLPTQVQPFRDERGQLKYRVRNPIGSDVILDRADMLHVHGLGFDGTVGYSVISQARESLGLMAAAERFGGSFFGNGSTFGGALTHPKQLGPEAIKNLRESVEAYGRGADKAHRFLILEEGTSYQQFGVKPNDAQFLETRQFQIAEVARWFNLPLHKLREMENSSVRANIEQESLDYYVSSLRPWLTRWEQELNRKLVSPRERFQQVIEFNLDGVLRGDMRSRYDSYAIGRQWGFLSQNDIRSWENLPPIDGGDTYLSPQNMVPTNRLNEVIDKQVEKDAPAETAPAPQVQPDDSRWVAKLEEQAALIGALQAQMTTTDAELVRTRAAHEALSGDAARLETERADLVAAKAAADAEAARLQGLAEEARAARDAALAAEAAATTAAHDAAVERDRMAARAADADAACVAAQQAADEARALAETEATDKQQAIQRAAAAEADLMQARADQAAAEAARQEAARRAEQAATVATDAEARAVAAGAAASDAESRAADLAAAKAAADTAAAEAIAAGQRLRVALATAARAVVVETVARLVRREAEKARSKRATPAKLRAWAESFYEAHEAETWAEALRPVVALHATLTNDARDADDLARALVAEHFAVSKRQILAASDADEFDHAVNRTLARWESTRAADVADAFIREELAHVAQ